MLHIDEQVLSTKFSSTKAIVLDASCSLFVISLVAQKHFDSNTTNENQCELGHIYTSRIHVTD